ncbi:MAG: xylulokinase [Pseudomonadota bacterium]
MYIGFDIGTTGLKGVVMDDAQRILASATEGYDVSRPHDGWSEQDPALWINALKGVLVRMGETVDLSGVKGIGLSGQMHGATLVGDDGQLRPCILWNDTRSEREAKRLDADPEFRAINGNIVFPGFTAPKLAWVRAHEPELFEATRHVLLPKDYVRQYLTGELASDMSDAAGTSWLDTEARDWSDVLLEKTGLSRSQMPRLVEGSEVSGGLRAEVAAEFGLTPGIAVAGGAGDNAASAVGVGVTQPGEAFVSLGTSGVLFAATEGYAPAPDTAVHTFCHALPGAWHQMGVILAATDALNWWAGISETTAEALTSGLGALEAPGETVFLPYLGGERTPLNDARIRGCFAGLGHASDRAALTRAVLEGVSFALRDCQLALRATGTELQRLIAVGGGSRSEYWLSAIATALDMAVEVPAAGDFGAAFGAARLGLMAAEGSGAEVAQAPEISRVIEPDASLVPAFDEGFAQYVMLRDAIGELS